MWKLLTGLIAEEMYDYFEQEQIFPEEQKGCRWKPQNKGFIAY